MTTRNSVESLISSYEKQAEEALSELRQQLSSATDELESVGDIITLKKVVDNYKRANSVNNETLSLLSGISSNTIGRMLSEPSKSKVETVQALLDAMGMTLTISRKG